MNREREYSGLEQMSPLSDRLIRNSLEILAHITFQDKGKNYDTACELLKETSVLIAANHPKSDTFLGMNAIARAFQPKTRAFYALANERLLPGGDDTVVAKIVRKLCAVSDIQLLPIYLSHKGWNKEERAEGNIPTILTVMTKLSEAGNLFFMYPEGNFYFQMGEAKKGLGMIIADERGFTVPVTTNIHPFSQHWPAINIHKPISNEQLHRLCSDIYGDESQPAQQLASDIVMSVIAHGLPARRRGFYERLCATMYGEQIDRSVNDDRERINRMALAAESIRPIIM